MFESLNEVDPVILIVLGLILAVPGLLVVRFILFMILPRSWLKRWFVK